MYKYRCKECGKTFSRQDEEKLVEKIHTHVHEDHGKHLSKRKIQRNIEEE